MIRLNMAAVLLTVNFNIYAAAIPFDTSIDTTIYRLATEQNDAAAQYLIGRKYYTGSTVEKNIAEAIKWFELAATQNHRKAQFQLGKMYLYGDGVPSNHKYALNYLRMAANNNYAEAQFELGNYYMLDKFGVKNFGEAVKWYRAAAERQHIRAMVQLGKILNEGQGGVKPKPDEAKHYLSLAAESGNSDALKYLRKISRRNVSPPQNAAAIGSFHEKLNKASNGHIPSQYEVGMAYLKGNGVDADVSQAAKWFRRAANNDHAEAQYRLSQLYRDGVGVEKNTSRGLQWLKIAATAGVPEAQKELQAMHLSDSDESLIYTNDSSDKSSNSPSLENKESTEHTAKNVTKNSKSVAVKNTVSHSAASKSDKDATKANKIDLEPTKAIEQFKLANRYLTGDGVEKNENIAAHWFEQAARQGHTEAQYKLGKMYKQGIGLTASVAKAKFWLSKAADAGHNGAMILLGEIKGINLADRPAVAERKTTPVKVKFSEPTNSAAFNHAPETITEAISDQVTTDTASEDIDTAVLQQANQGNVDAQYKVGMIYLLGTGNNQRKDTNQGIRWLIEAANKNYLQAQVALGELFYKGRAQVQKNYIAAAQWYEKAAEAGDAEAQFNLGNMYKNGLGVEKNNSEAIKWYRQAANQGHKEARRRLGGCRIC